jgi:proliferating cell nuclear antigen
MEDDVIFRFRTIKASSFRTLIEAVKEVLPETNMEINREGISIKSMDGTHLILVHLALEASAFDEFYCAATTIIGLNMVNMHKLIKTINNNEILSITMLKSDTTKIIIEIQNSQKQMETRYSLNLMDLDIENINPPPVVFPSVVKMNSTDFQKIIRDMNALGENVEILSSSDELQFRCKGDFAEQETVYNLRSREDEPTVPSTEIVQGVFTLKYLMLFTKCTSLSPTITMYLKNKWPVTIEYDVAGLGNIKMALAPISIKPPN